MTGHFQINTSAPSNKAASRSFRSRLVSLLAGAAVVFATSETRALAETKWGDLFASHIMEKWPDPNTITHKGWEYENSIVLHGMEKIYKRGGDRRIFEYIRRFADHHMAADGSVAMRIHEKNLDRIQPGMLLLFLYEETRDAKYKDAASYVFDELQKFPRNELGGFWHKGNFPNEMWADGIYMAEPFAVKYAAITGGHAEAYGEAFTQMTLVHEKTRHQATGLLVHAWDADRNAVWADPDTGRSPHIWSRGLGWYAMALVDVLEYMPKSHPFHDKTRSILLEIVEGLKKTQSPGGLWHQVIELPNREKNWPEISGSAMFAYSIKKGIRLGLIDPRYDEVATKAWNGMQEYIRIVNGEPQISQVVCGMGVQKDFDAYVGQKRLTNSPHGLCAILFAASEMEH